ncbi:hypothetical protein MUP51_10690 [Candidatus Bathyarchaeota archaeon]|nr:hypothetical protein [Candidatus Bathyarchaeota archaeon]TFH17868.1 MAG: hypothetical protein E4H04_04325 [Candidatus Bathyarchaeota archaeon]
MSSHTLPYHLYIPSGEGLEEVVLDGLKYVGFKEEYLDPRGGGSISKAKRVLGFLEEHRDGAFFSVEIVDALSEYGVKPGDIMANVRRFERKGLVYVRGYKSDEGQTPFQEGYLLTWLDPDISREDAILDAVKRTDRALEGRASSSPVMERVHRIRDIVLEHSELRKLVSPSYIQSQLKCSPNELRISLDRSMQLYPDLKVVKLFDAYRYLYHDRFSPEDLSAAVHMKKNYIRLSKGADNRIGHNWEAVTEWFIDKFTTGAKFVTQNHRNGGMDPRRIILHLIKSVGGRRRNAEVDRIWEVTPGVFSAPITNILSCKWGLVNKKHVDDFLEVIRWSKDYGVDTPEGREIKNGVLGVFAASAFNPRENVHLKDGSKITLAQYAARRHLQLITAADFNEKLRERGAEKYVTVQKICRASKNEAEVMRVMDAIWEKPDSARGVLQKTLNKNADLFKFEERLEEVESPEQDSTGKKK